MLAKELEQFPTEVGSGMEADSGVLIGPKIFSSQNISPADDPGSSVDLKRPPPRQEVL
jgi:hypothetical protein